MAPLLQLLTVVVFANALSVVLSCSGSSPPPPCSWTTCQHEWRDDWAPPGSQGRCVEQSRNAHHVHKQHHGSGSCPAPQPCPPSSTQNRVLCSCVREHCHLQDWSSWVDVPAPDDSSPCIYQQRSRGYSITTSYLDVIGSCSGVASVSCPPPETERRDCIMEPNIEGFR